MPSFYISAAHKSSGKTTLSIGLCAALRERGLKVQAFKKGPDYIDPIWLSLASAKDCYNLDFFTSSRDFIKQQFCQFGQQGDVNIVEGNMGLYDGISLDGSDSNAAMAKLLGLPIVLVVDCSGTSRGIAPLLNGYRQFDSQLQFAGVILNKVAGNRHQTKLRQVIEAYTNFKILGAVPRSEQIRLTERHLGLIPGNEMGSSADAVIQLLGETIKEYVDIDALLEIESSQSLFSDCKQMPPQNLPPKTLRIAVAMDEAFGFYYPGDLQRFQQLGVELVKFNTQQDSALPTDIDGLFIGGGFPEMRLEALSSNVAMLNSVRESIQQGLPAYAECGGLMYLCDALEQENQKHPLCGVLPATVKMHKRPQGRGYVKLESTFNHPWLKGDEKNQSRTRTASAHEFHYSSLEGLPDDMSYAYSVKRGTGIDGTKDGIILHNLLASYTHLRTTDECSWVDDFVSFVQKIRR